MEHFISRAKIGGTPPENIPPVEHIKKVEKRLKKAKPKLLLGDKDFGLVPQNFPNNKNDWVGYKM